MPRENVEIVRRIYDAAARRDSATVLALYDPDVELDMSRLQVVGLAGGGFHRGHEGLRNMFRDWHEAWDNIDYDFDELIDAGEHVISVVTRRGRGRASGAEVELSVALVWTIREGKVVRVVWFTSVEDALDAAGRRESAMSQENAQLARRWMEAINRRDPDAIDRLVHRDYELHNPWTPGGGLYRGVDAVKSFGREFFDTWEVYAVEEQRIIEAGDTVVVLAHARAEGKASGLTLDGPLAHVHTVRDGRLARTQVFLDHDAALEAAGLLE